MKKFLVLMVMFSVAGCNGLSEPVQSVDWYKEHKIERAERLAACRANPGELALTANCVNAKSAQDQIDLGSRNFRINATAPTFTRKGE
jgi:hypothetical protein